MSFRSINDASGSINDASGSINDASGSINDASGSIIDYSRVMLQIGASLVTNERRLGSSFTIVMSVYSTGHRTCK
jgi:hypothetical protein